MKTTPIDAADHHEPPDPSAIRVSPSDAAATARMFDLLLGDNLSGRKEHIALNGHLYLDEVDVS